MKITKIDLLYCDPVEDGWRPSFCRIYTDEGFTAMEKSHCPTAVSTGFSARLCKPIAKRLGNRPETGSHA